MKIIIFPIVRRMFHCILSDQPSVAYAILVCWRVCTCVCVLHEPAVRPTLTPPTVARYINETRTWRLFFFKHFFLDSIMLSQPWEKCRYCLMPSLRRLEGTKQSTRLLAASPLPPPFSHIPHRSQ